VHHAEINVKRERTHRRAGFTLVELLVAVAIFTSLMAGVMLLFTSAVRTVRQAEQIREAYDVARGAMRVLQDDLVSAYSARERGDIFQFYGTPIGMTFIAFVEDEEGVPELARITYVLYHDDDAAEEGLRARVTYLEDDEGNVVVDENGQPKPYYRVSLLRYVETDVSDLESFRVEWDKVGVRVGGDETLYALKDLVTLRMANSPCVPGDEHCQERLERVTKRQLWIEMLAGQAGNFWEAENLDPADYVVLDNILVETVPQLPMLPVDTAPPDGFEQPTDVAYQLDPNSPGYLYTSRYPTVFFQYGITDRYDAPDNPDLKYMARWTIYWQDYINMLSSPDDPPVALAPGLDTRVDVGSPLFPRLPELVRTRFSLYFDSPYVGAPPFNSIFEQEVNLRSGYARQNIQKL
jgi:prepilin-type N-terminal cleavage/methylation domain-containing protein